MAPAKYPSILMAYTTIHGTIKPQRLKYQRFEIRNSKLVLKRSTIFYHISIAIYIF